MKKEANGEKETFTNSTVMTKYQGSLTALSKLKIRVNDRVVDLWHFKTPWHMDFSLYLWFPSSLESNKLKLILLVGDNSQCKTISISGYSINWIRRSLLCTFCYQPAGSKYSTAVSRVVSSSQDLGGSAGGSFTRQMKELYAILSSSYINSARVLPLLYSQASCRG